MSFRDGNVDNIPGSYELKNLRIFSQTGIGADLDYIFLEMSIYENIFANNISATLTLAESMNIASNLPIVEGDIVRIHAAINSRDDIMAKVDNIKTEIKMDFEVVRITDRTNIQKDVTAITLVLASHGTTDSSFRRVSKSFNQKLYSDMVQEVFDESFQVGGLLDYGRSSVFSAAPSSDVAWTEPKPIEIEPTVGMYNIVIPSWNPLKTFNFLASRSTNMAGIADWIFYEDPDVFKFIPINTLLSAGPVGDHYTQMSNVKDGNRLNEDIYRNFHDIQFNYSGNLLHAARNGLLNNEMLVYNMYNKIMTHYKENAFPEADNYILEKGFDYIENFDLKEHCDTGRIPLTLPLTSMRYSLDPGQGKKTMLMDHPYMFDEQPQGYEPDLYLRERMSQIEAMKYYKLTATGPGLFSRKAGDKINLNLASPELNSDGKLDKRLQGNFLITSLRRVFTPDTHSMVLELTKDNYWDESTDPIWLAGRERPKTRDKNLSIGGGL